MKKILAIVVIALMGLMIIPSVGSENITFTYSHYYDYDTYIVEDYPNSNFEGQNALGIRNETGKNQSAILYFPDVKGDFQNLSIKLFLRGQRTPTFDPANVTLYRLIGNFTPSNATWNDKYANVPWTNPGGDYNTTEIDTNYITSTSFLWYSFDVTSFYWDVYNSTYINLGFLLKINPTDTSNYTAFNFYSSNSTSAPYLNITYADGSGQYTNLYEDKWNLEGYSGGSPKLASTIYSEISNCTALVWKNDTSGYYYTYWPGIGFTEDEYINYGDGVFILVDADTTWDHT